LRWKKVCDLRYGKAAAQWVRVLWLKLLPDRKFATLTL
jgi:hypothetical protein